MSKKKVLATSWHPGGANAIIPVIRRLKEDEIFEVVTIGYEFSEKSFHDAGIDFRRIQDYGVGDVSYDSMEKILAKETPNLILTGTSIQDVKHRDVIEQTTTLVGRRIGIKTLSALDFWGDYHERFSDLEFSSATDFTVKDKFKFLPDKIAVPDVYSMKEMLREGFDEEIIVVTGNPYFDSLESKAREFSVDDKKRVREQVGLEKDVLLLYAGGILRMDVPKFGYWDLDNIDIINRALKNSSVDAGLVSKLHPRSPDDYVKEMNDYVKNNGEGRIKLVRDINPHQLILASDMTFTACSTLAFEAALMGKPCVSLQPGLKCPDYLANLTKNEIIPVGYTREVCDGIARRVLIDPSYTTNELLPKLSDVKADGKATERVTNLVYEMANA